MSYDPNRPQGGASDPYGPPSDPYGQPSSGAPYNQPQSGQPYNQPQSGQPYNQPQSGQPYNPYDQPASGQPYNQPQSGQPYNPYDQPASGQPYNQPYNPTAPLPPGDPYANPAGQYSTPNAYGQPAVDAYGQPIADPYGYPAGQPGYPGGAYPPPPQPPQKSKTGLIVGLIAGAVVLIIVFCGVGTWLVNRNSDKTDTSASSGPSAVSTTGAGTATSAPASPSATPDNRTVVQPTGGPYNFRVPDGFQSVKVPTSDTSTGSSAQYSSAVATSATETNDFLIVDAYALNYDADSVDQTQLATQFDNLVKQINQDPSSRQNVTYNGNNGFWYKFDFGTSKAYSYFLFHGSNELQVRCQWTDQESTIQRGCEDLLSSLQITG
jgi:hypothetical protein